MPRLLRSQLRLGLILAFSCVSGTNEDSERSFPLLSQELAQTPYVSQGVSRNKTTFKSLVVSRRL